MNVQIGLRGCQKPLLITDSTVEIPRELGVSAVARNLSRVFRFSGQTDYTVAEHSVLIARWMKLDGYGSLYQYAALVHDFPEGMGFGDTNTFLKAECCGVLKGVEDRVLYAAWDRWCPTWEEKRFLFDEVHLYDKKLGTYEAVHFGVVDLPVDPLSPGLRIDCMYSIDAYATWMETWEDLQHGR